MSLHTHAQALYISTISLWEVAMLEKKGGLFYINLVCNGPCKLLRPPDFSLKIFLLLLAAESSNLPGDFHGDPADRLIVATARSLNAHLITRDAKILYYAKQGHVLCIEV